MNEKKERMILLASQLYTLGYAVEDARAELQRLSQSDDTAAPENAGWRPQARPPRSAGARWRRNISLCATPDAIFARILKYFS